MSLSTGSCHPISKYRNEPDNEDGRRNTVTDRFLNYATVAAVTVLVFFAFFGAVTVMGLSGFGVFPMPY